MPGHELFRFHASEVFAISGRGFVLRGHVLSGEARVGTVVTFRSHIGLRRGRVSGIEIDRRLVDSTQLGVEHGLLLSGFEDLLAQLPTEERPESETWPTAQELLGVVPPIEVAEAL